VKKSTRVFEELQHEEYVQWPNMLNLFSLKYLSMVAMLTHSPFVFWRKMINDGISMNWIGV